MDNEEKHEVVADGGWPDEKRCYQKKALLFKTLAILWVVPSLTSLFVIAYDFPRANGVLETIKIIRIEQWISLLLLLLEPAFIYLAIRYRRTEIPTEHTEPFPEPDPDPKNLY